MKQLGFTGGVITKYHQTYDAAEAGEEYLDKLELLQYDMLYGDMEAFEGESPYEPSDMTMGSVPIRITGADLEYHRLLVTGENFTEVSVIYSGDQAMATEYIDSEHVIAHVDDGAAIEQIDVAQVAKDGTVLGRTEALVLG